MHNPGWSQAAEAELKVLLERSNSNEYTNDIVKHNLVVFRDGEGALQTLPPLVDVVVEARLNLVIYYLRSDEVEEAYNLIKDLEPSTPQVCACPLSSSHDFSSVGAL